jgi:hypothetical protein
MAFSGLSDGVRDLVAVWERRQTQIVRGKCFRDIVHVKVANFPHNLKYLLSISASRAVRRIRGRHTTGSTFLLNDVDARFRSRIANGRFVRAA